MPMSPSGEKRSRAEFEISGKEATSRADARAIDAEGFPNISSVQGHS